MYWTIPITPLFNIWQKTFLEEVNRPRLYSFRRYHNRKIFSFAVSTGSARVSIKEDATGKLPVTTCSTDLKGLASGNRAISPACTLNGEYTFAVNQLLDDLALR